MTDDAPRAQPGRRLARLGRTKPAVMARIKADAERRDPQPRPLGGVLLEGALGLGTWATTRCTAWKPVTLVRDLMPVVGSRWTAAHALVREASQEGTRGGQQPLTALLRGRGGYVIGGRRPILTTRPLRQSGRATRQNVITCVDHQRRWRPYEGYRAAGWPVGTGVVASAWGAVVKPRREGEGKRWRLDGAEAIRALRSLHKSHDTDLPASWRFRARPVWARLDGRKPTYRPMPPLRRVASLKSVTLM